MDLSFKNHSPIFDNQYIYHFSFYYISVYICPFGRFFSSFTFSLCSCLCIVSFLFRSTFMPLYDCLCVCVCVVSLSVYRTIVLPLLFFMCLLFFLSVSVCCRTYLSGCLPFESSPSPLSFYKKKTLFPLNLVSTSSMTPMDTMVNTSYDF